ncbi:HAD family hydrolase [Microbacterium sp. AZCO]|uniref:D-glycero-alpha-D-manno-heptose-1,7-bisphosphate 7-phosphatase n=1 Tax=Microbacterium sp. AZCO TaxID=3142976 RepID=UPI0031F3811C
MGSAEPNVSAVLFDRDGTLVVDVPYNGDPALVTPMPHALEAVARVRAAGLAVGLVTNQSGIGRGILTHSQVRAVNARIEELLGPFDVQAYCPHTPEQGCGCRKPRPGLIVAACAALGVDPASAVVVGDIGADVDAARAAGSASVLVPTQETLAAEIEAAPLVAPDLAEAVRLLLASRAEARR